MFSCKTDFNYFKWNLMNCEYLLQPNACVKTIFLCLRCNYIGEENLCRLEIHEFAIFNS